MDRHEDKVANQVACRQLCTCCIDALEYLLGVIVFTNRYTDDIQLIHRLQNIIDSVCAQQLLKSILDVEEIEIDIRFLLLYAIEVTRHNLLINGIIRYKWLQFELVCIVERIDEIHIFQSFRLCIHASLQHEFLDGIESEKNSGKTLLAINDRTLTLERRDTRFQIYHDANKVLVSFTTQHNLYIIEQLFYLPIGYPSIVTLIGRNHKLCSLTAIEEFKQSNFYGYVFLLHSILLLFRWPKQICYVNIKA